MLIVALSHSAFNMTNGQKITSELLHLPDDLAALIVAVAVMVLAVVVVLFTRGRLSYEPERAAARPAEAGGMASQPRVQ